MNSTHLTQIAQPIKAWDSQKTQPQVHRLWACDQHQLQFQTRQHFRQLKVFGILSNKILKVLHRGLNKKLREPTMVLKTLLKLFIVTLLVVWAVWLLMSPPQSGQLIGISFLVWLLSLGLFISLEKGER